MCGKGFLLMVGKILTAIADLVAPRECAVCGRTLRLSENCICIYCSADFPYTRYWKYSHNAMADRFNHLIAEHTVACAEPQERERYSFAAALYFYGVDAGVNRISQALKYEGNFHIGGFFSTILGKKLMQSVDYKDVSLVVPIPLHWLRKLRRGYNQADIIGRNIAKVLDVRFCPNLLYRNRKTRSQTTLSGEDRRKNLNNAFSVNKSVFRKEVLASIKNNCHILIVDDVFTTGATAFSAYIALRDFLTENGIPLSRSRISIATLGFVGSP